MSNKEVALHCKHIGHKKYKVYNLRPYVRLSSENHHNFYLQSTQQILQPAVIVGLLNQAILQPLGCNLYLGS